MEDTLKRILEASERIYGPSSRVILGRARTVDVVDARDAAIWVYRELTSYSQPIIGNRFNRDHKAIYHSLKRTANRIMTSEKYRERVNKLMEELK